MTRGRGYNILFGFTLAVMTALAIHWVVFFERAVAFERAAAVNDLRSATTVTALKLGHSQVPPPMGALQGPWPLEIVSYQQGKDSEYFSRLVPMHPQLGVRPAPAVLAALDRKMRSRWIMVIGEGGLLFLLITVTMGMLYRLAHQERRHMAQMESFLSTVTHEMKTPIAGIKSMLQTFAAGRVPEGQGARLYAMALKESERLEHMIENVLISGRLRADALRTQVEPMALRPALDKFVDHRRRHLVDRPDAVQLAWELHGDDVQVLADASAFRVILENLTDNAFKYGGEEPTVTLRVQRQAPGFSIAVEDNGIGFDPTKAEFLFTPFRRGLDLNGAIMHGTGLGLSIARSLAREMGGELTATSAGPSRGSRFTLTLKEASA